MSLSHYNRHGARVTERSFYKAVTVDESDLLGVLVERLTSLEIPYCVIGGQGVNAYVDPLVSLDLDVVVAADRIDEVLAALPSSVSVERFPHSVNVLHRGSGLRIQFQLDPRYATFPGRATARVVLGTTLRVAAVEDVLDGKVWAASDPSRRASKRQKDLADIARLIEQFPELRSRVPRPILDKLV